MNWNFGFFDVGTLKRAAQAAGLGAGASALSPQEAEGAQLPGFQRNFVSRFVARNKENFPVGTVEPEVFAQIQEKLPEAQNIVSSGTHAGFTRFMKSGWHPAKTAARMGEILDSKEAAVVKNWQENTGKGVYAEYGILLPYKKDPTFVPFYLNNDKELVFKTLLPPSKGQMKKAGYGEEGGLLPLISRSHDAPSTQRMPLSAVTQQPAHGCNIDDALSFSKAESGKLEGLDPVSGRSTTPMSGLRGNPASAQPPGLSAVEERSSNVTRPEPLNVNNKFISTAGLTAGLGSGLALPGGAQAAGQRGENGEPSTFSALARQAALGTRGVLEGVGSGLTLGLGAVLRGSTRWAEALPSSYVSLRPTAPGTGCLGFSDENPLPDQSLVPLKGRPSLRLFWRLFRSSASVNHQMTPPSLGPLIALRAPEALRFGSAVGHRFAGPPS